MILKMITNQEENYKTEEIPSETVFENLKPSGLDYVTGIYTRPYSLTTSVFDSFCETQVTYNSHHSSNLENMTNILN